MDDRPPTYFFMHVMKTGGSTFLQHVAATFPPEAVYPPAGHGTERILAYATIDRLRRLGPEERRAVRIYTGHFPFVARDIVGADVTLTVLRDPVDRTLSLLRHCKRMDERLADMSLEDIYDDAWVHPLYIRNYQAKQFAMTTDDKLESHLDVVDVDGRRLEIALANVDRVDVLGLHERYADFLDALREEHGWQIGDVPDRRVSTERWEVPPHLPERIAADNAADMALYDHARRVVETRGRRPTRPGAGPVGVTGRRRA